MYQLSSPETPKKISLIRKPIPPIARIPIKHIFKDSHSSLRPGFVASFSNLAAD
jgi:hypothetical protein